MRRVCETKRDKKSAERAHQNDAAEEEETFMTTEQMALVKKLIQKHEIEATDAEWTLIFIRRVSEALMKCSRGISSTRV